MIPPRTSSRLDIKLIAGLTLALWLVCGLAGYCTYRALPHSVQHGVAHQVKVAKAKVLHFLDVPRKQHRRSRERAQVRFIEHA